MNRFRFFQRLILPTLAGIAAWFAVPLSFWDSARAGLLTALSVLAAAVLVRLARGLPFTNADHFEVEEIRQVTGSMKQIMSSLFALIIVILVSMFLMVFSQKVADITYAIMPTGPIPTEKTLSAFISFILGYVVARIIAVVRSDVGLVELQSKFLIRAVEQKVIKNIPQEKVPQPIEYKSAHPYGHLVQ